MLNVADLVIIIFILFGCVIGFKRGLFKQGIKSLGIFLMLVLAFIFKNPVSVFLYKHLPFFPFGGVIKGVTVLNILVYEVLAFLLVLGILLIIYKVIILASNIFERILDFTIVLGVISSFLGMILGFIEYVILSFIILYVLSLPVFNVDFFKSSKLNDMILSKTPIFSSFIDKQYKVIDEFSSLKQKYKSEKDTNKFNLETLDLFLKYDIVDVDSVEYLINNKKIKIEGTKELLNKYRKE